MSLERLEQITIEDKYSRKNIREHILIDLNSTDTEVTKKILIATQAIHGYMKGNYYPSKHKRIAHLLAQKITITEIVMEILIIILPFKEPQTIQSICGRLAGVLNYEDPFDGVKTAAELITVVCASDLYDILLPNVSSTGSAMVESKYTLPDSTMEYIRNTKYLPPMICEPRILTDNYQSGYITQHDSVVLKGNVHAGKLPLDALNISNAIPLSIDERMLQLEETPKNELDTHEKEENFNNMKEASRLVYNDLIKQGNKFYLTHKLDERHRMYCQGYHVSYQSSQYKRSLINLHKKELITC